MLTRVKRFVELELWTLDMVTNIYNKGVITQTEYEDLKKLFK